ncbi:MAG: arsenic efflux protein [Clostridia bacterium]|nr:arsenic efflux protein [Clostridia bacterium]
MLHALEHAFLDTLKLIPFLFLTYLLLEWIEHKAAQKTASIAAKAGKLGPLAGSLIGVLPQCGFSASASNLYAGGVISAGTLIAIFVSTSDEMLPIMISEQIAPVRILLILFIKVICGILTGFVLDFILRFLKKDNQKSEISHICEEENCHCEKGIFLSSVIHTLQITIFVFIFSFLIGLAVHLIGEDQISAFTANAGIFTPLVASLIGLIPNCASSVVITELFLGGMISTGAMLAGLIANSGVGLLVLFRVNKNLRHNLLITLAVFLTGAFTGILFDLLGIVL